MCVSLVTSGADEGLSQGLLDLPWILSGHSRFFPGSLGLLPVLLGSFQHLWGNMFVYMPEVSTAIAFVLSQLPEASPSPAEAFTVLFFSCPPPHLSQPQKQWDYCYPSTADDTDTQHGVPLAYGNACTTPSVGPTGSVCVEGIEVTCCFIPTSRQQFETGYIGRTQLGASFKF